MPVPLDLTYYCVCPTCCGVGGSCHACSGTGRTDEHQTMVACRWMWAVPHCDCDACARLPNPPD